LQKIQHGGKIHQHSTRYLSKQESTQTGCYTIAACVPFEPLEKCMTFKDNFRGLSRTLRYNFQDFQDQSNFIGLSRSWDFFFKNSGLSRGVGPCFTLWAENWGTGYRGTFTPILVSLGLCLRVVSPCGTDRQTDARARPVMWPTRTTAE